LKLKALLAALAAAALCVSAAAASPGKVNDHGKGKHNGKRDDSARTNDRGGATKARKSCEGRKLVLRGLYVSGSAGADGAGSFVMEIKRANGGKRLGLAGKQATLTVDAATKFRRHGHASLADLVASDRLSVKVRACRAASTGDAGSEATDPPALTLLARKVDARPAKAGGETGTGTTPTVTTTTETGP
jgi:hypothetical protein